MQVTFLGTAGSAPTAQRSPSSLLVEDNHSSLLFDCGEGTARQLLCCGRSSLEIGGCALTHLHADHYLGLPGLLLLCEGNDRTAPFTVAGPTGVRRLLGPLVESAGAFGFPVSYTELEGPSALALGSFRVLAFPVAHGPRAFGFAMADAGRARLVVSGDTRPSETLTRVAADADLLVHEATFCDDEADRARQTGHSTAAEAASVAREANVGALALVHLSSRHPPAVALREARRVFPRAELPRDLDRATIDGQSVVFDRVADPVPA